MTSKMLGLKIVLLSLIFIAIPSRATQAQGGLDVSNHYIIKFKNDSKSKSQQFSYFDVETTQQASERLVREAKNNHAGLIRQGLIKSKEMAIDQRLIKVLDGAFKGFSAKLTPESLELIKNDPLVESVEKEIVLKATATGTQTTPLLMGLWGLDRIDQRNLPLSETYTYGEDGSGVHIYVIDSGIDTSHFEFGNRLRNGFDVLDMDTDPVDCTSHGTGVASIAAGFVTGVAKNAFIHAVRVIGCNNEGLATDAGIGLKWIRDNHQKPAVVIMAIASKAGDEISSVMTTETQALINAGVIVVAGAGNDRLDACNNSPTNVRDLITVAATTTLGATLDRAYSNNNGGTCVDLFAPGVGILMAHADPELNSKQYYYDSGTSFAAPHVGGAIARYLQNNPTALLGSVANWVLSNSTVNVIGGDLRGSPNRLLFVDGSESTTTPPGNGGQPPTNPPTVPNIVKRTSAGIVTLILQ